MENRVMTSGFAGGHDYVYFYVASLSGIGMGLLISKMIPENQVLRFIGSNSLLILGLHLPAFVVLRGVQRIMVTGSVNVLDGSFQGACMYTLMQLLILLPVIYLINRHFRFVLGRW